MLKNRLNTDNWFVWLLGIINIILIALFVFWLVRPNIIDISSRDITDSQLGYLGLQVTLLGVMLAVVTLIIAALGILGYQHLVKMAEAKAGEIALAVLSKDKKYPSKIKDIVSDKNKSESENVDGAKEADD